MARNNLADRIEDMAEALIIVALVIGGIVVGMWSAINFTLAGPNNTGLDAIQVLALASVLTIAFAAIALGFIRHMRASTGKKR